MNGPAHLFTGTSRSMAWFIIVYDMWNERLKPLLPIYWQISGAGAWPISGKLKQTTYQIWMSCSEIGLAHILKIEISKKWISFPWFANEGSILNWTKAEDMKLSSKTGELKSALANGAIPYSADVDFFFFEIEVIDFSLVRFSNWWLILAQENK